jgi:SWI/SNF-related matrix-associated actin-dependent regulator 1 of chromatin subfamily A
MGKLEAAKDLINSIVESGEKVLVFSSFNAPLKELHEMYDNSCLILGETPVEERGDIVKNFQTNPDCQVFLGGYKSAGVGITLTAASNVILLDYPWNPADREQSIDRAHRIGSTAESLNIYEFHTEKTTDEFMKKLLSRKQDIFDQVIDGKESIELEGTIDEMIKMIEEQNNLLDLTALCQEKI